MHIVLIIQLFINNDQRGLLPPQDISDVEEKAEGEENKNKKILTLKKSTFCICFSDKGELQHCP